MLKNALPGRETQIRLMRFLVVGGTAAVVQFCVLALVKHWFVPNLAFTVSFVCSTTTHYSLNRFWALPSDRRDNWRQLGEYLATAGVNYLVNIGLFALGHSVFGLGVLWSAVLALPPSTAIVFLFLNYRVFRRRAAAKP